MQRPGSICTCHIHRGGIQGTHGNKRPRDMMVRVRRRQLKVVKEIIRTERLITWK